MINERRQILQPIPKRGKVEWWSRINDSRVSSRSRSSPIACFGGSIRRREKSPEHQSGFHAFRLRATHSALLDDAEELGLRLATHLSSLISSRKRVPPFARSTRVLGVAGFPLR